MASSDSMTTIEQVIAGVVAGGLLEEISDRSGLAAMGAEDTFKQVAYVTARLAVTGIAIGAVVDYASSTGRNWAQSPVGTSVFAVAVLTTQGDMLQHIAGLNNKTFTSLWHMVDMALANSESSSSPVEESKGQLKGPTSRQLNNPGATEFSIPSNPTYPVYGR